jgi:hypothetical protein
MLNVQKFVDRLKAQLDVADEYAKDVHGQSSHAIPSTWMIQNSNLRDIMNELQQAVFAENADRNRIHCPD